MANFPSNPSPGDTWTTGAGKTTYVFSGSTGDGDGVWRIQAPSNDLRISAISDYSNNTSSPVDEVESMTVMVIKSGSQISAGGQESVLYVEDNGPDSYTELLLHFDGADEATSTTDSSSNAHTITMSGAKIDNGASVFGTSSVYFGATSDYIKIDGSSFPAGSDLFNGDLTIELWFSRSGTISGDLYLLDKTTGGSGWGLVWNTDSTYGTANSWIFTSANIDTNTDDGPTGANLLTGGANVAAPSDGQWHHIAIVKSGNNYAMYIDGVERDTASKSYKPTDGTSQHFYIASYRGISSTGFSGGYVDEVRISKGVARYTSNFELPTKQFGRPELKIKDGSGDYIIKLKQIN